ncbi:MAG: PIN domain-containing protein [Treponema sp.]|jgi:predicted nucleic acid-binding protein|nr:PIN domain-containing protein [Treponema sp.]
MINYDNNILHGLYYKDSEIIKNIEFTDLDIRISRMVYLEFNKRTEKEINADIRDLRNEFIKQFPIVDINRTHDITMEIFNLHNNYLKSKQVGTLKPKDLIIALTAKHHNATLITRDKDFNKVKDYISVKCI